MKKKKVRNELGASFRNLPMYEKAVITMLVLGSDEDKKLLAETGIDGKLVKLANLLASLNPSLRKYTFKKIQLDLQKAAKIIDEKQKMYNGVFDNLDRVEYGVLFSLNAANKQEKSNKKKKTIKNNKSEILQSPMLTLRQSELYEKFLQLPKWLKDKVLAESGITSVGQADKRLRKVEILPTPRQQKDVAINKVGARENWGKKFTRKAEKEFEWKEDSRRLQEICEFYDLLRQEDMEEEQWSELLKAEGITEKITLYKHDLSL